MGVLQRLRHWLTSVRGDTQTEDTGAEQETPRLDPDNVQENRLQGSDDAVQRLQELQYQDEK
jgi:hypothetical protein